MSGESNPPVLGNVPPNPIAAAKANRTNRLPTPAQEAQQRLERGASVTEPIIGFTTADRIKTSGNVALGSDIYNLLAAEGRDVALDAHYTPESVEMLRTVVGNLPAYDKMIFVSVKVEWQWQTFGKYNKQVLRSVSLIPDWRRDPDARHKFLEEVKAGETFIAKVLGHDDPLFWPKNRSEAVRLIKEAQEKEMVDAVQTVKRSAITADDPTRAKFFAKTNDTMSRYKVIAAGRDEFSKKALGVESHNDWRGTYDEAVDRHYLAVVDEYGPGQLDILRLDIKMIFVEADVEMNFMAATGKVNLDAALNIEPTMKPSEVIIKVRDYVKAEKVKAEKAKSENGAQKAAVLPSGTDTPKSANESASTPSSASNAVSTPALSGISEAGFSTNFFWVDEYGQEEQFTMRESTWEKGLEALPKFKTKLRAMGYMPKGEWAAKHGVTAPATQAAPTPQSASKGTAMCALIKVARSFEGNKPQLQFECNGFEKSLKYTRDPLHNILKGVTNPFTGQPFTEADMTDNSMFGGAFLVDWERKEKDGKTFTNVLAVRNAGQIAKSA